MSDSSDDQLSAPGVKPQCPTIRRVKHGVSEIDGSTNSGDVPFKLPALAAASASTAGATDRPERRSMRSSAASRPSATPGAVQAMLKSKEAKLIDDHCCWCFGYNCSSRGHAPDACERRERPDMSDFRSSESVTRSESIRRATARSRQPHGRVQTRRTRVEQEAHRKRYTTAGFPDRRPRPKSGRRAEGLSCLCHLTGVC